MDSLIDIANRLVDKTGIKAKEHFDHVDLTINGDKLGSLAYDASNRPYYFSVPEHEVVTGSLDELGKRIVSDLDGLFEFVPVDPEMYKEQLTTSCEAVEKQPFTSLIESTVSTPALKVAILATYKQYKSA